MRTEDLITALAADTRAQPTVARLLLPSLGFAGLLALTLFIAVYGPRPDLGRALADGHVLIKHLLGPVAGIAALGAALRAARPGARIGGWGWALLAAPVIAGMALVADLVSLPAASWSAAFLGHSVTACLLGVALLSLPFFGASLYALGHGASTEPRVAGALAGLMSGGLGAAFYAFACYEDTALFYAVWYSTAVLGLAALGASIGPRVLRW